VKTDKPKKINLRKDKSESLVEIEKIE